MATDIVIKFEGGVQIEGECTISGFEKQLEAHSFSEAFSNPRDATGTGQTAGRTNVSDVAISSVSSQHSNLLKKAMFENKAFDKLTISFLKQVDDKTKAYEVKTYKNVYITSYSLGKSTDSPGHESWTFNATNIHDAFSIQDATTHQLTEATTCEIDFAKSATA